MYHARTEASRIHHGRAVVGSGERHRQRRVNGLSTRIVDPTPATCILSRAPAHSSGGFMEATTTSIPGVIVFTPRPYVDRRGFFSRTFDAAVARRVGIDPTAFVQDSVSRTAKGCIRGLHVRVGHGENKLVRCSAGAIYDVVVDLRPWSPTFRQWLSFDLDGDSQRSIYIPAGCAHGFQSLTEPADTSYRINREHDPSEDLTIAYNDPELGVAWPLPVTVMSERDQTAPPLRLLGDELSAIRA